MESELIYGFFSSVQGRFRMEHEELQLSSNVRINLERDPDTGVPFFIEIIEQPNKYAKLYGDKVVSINAIVGENSVGKTTIIQTLGLHPYAIERLSLRENFFWIVRFFYNNQYYYKVEGYGVYLIKELVELSESVSTGCIDESDLFSFTCKYDPDHHIFRQVMLDNSVIDDIHIIYDFDLSGKIYEWNEPDYHMLIPLDSDSFINRQYCHRDYHSIVKYLKYMQLLGKGQHSPYLRVDNIRMLIDNSPYPVIEQDCCKCEVAYDEFITKVEKQKNINIELYRSDKDKLDKVWDNLKEYLNKIKRDYFFKDSYRSTICIPVTEFDEDIIGLAKAIEEYNNLIKEDHKLKCTFSGMSSGQEKVVDIMAGINSTLENQASGSHCIVLLDEPEKGFHPEMARNLIDMLVRAVDDFKGTFQFVLTTHSPFIISDIPRKHVHCLEVDKSEMNTIHITSSEKGLLSNIPEILHDTFFLKSPFGEFANRYFEYLCKCINDLSDFQNESIDYHQLDYLGQIDHKDEKCTFTENVIWLKSVIDDISEPTIHLYLNNCLSKKLDEIKDEEMLDSIISYHESQAKYFRELRNNKNNI